MITITLIPGALSRTGAVSGSAPQDTATTTLDGVLYTAQSAHGASMALARQLVAAGCPDQPWECRNAAHQRTLYGGSLHKLATLTVSHSPSTRIVSYVEYPDRT